MHSDCFRLKVRVIWSNLFYEIEPCVCIPGQAMLSRGLPISRFWTWQTRSTLLPWSVQAWRGLCDPQHPNACARKWHGRGSWKKIFSIKEVFSMKIVLNEIGEKCTPWDWNHIFHATIFYLIRRTPLRLHLSKWSMVRLFGWPLRKPPCDLTKQVRPEFQGKISP